MFIGETLNLISGGLQLRLSKWHGWFQQPREINILRIPSVDNLECVKIDQFKLPTCLANILLNDFVPKAPGDWILEYHHWQFPRLCVVPVFELPNLKKTQRKYLDLVEGLLLLNNGVCCSELLVLQTQNLAVLQTQWIY